MTPATRRPPEGGVMTLAYADGVAAEVVELLGPACTRIEVAGSVRRRRATVGDVEVVCISRMAPEQVDLFGEVITERNLLDQLCDRLQAEGVLSKRVGEGGSTAWGYGARRAWFNGIALDIFGTTAPQFGVALLLRTGPAAWNKRLVLQYGHGGTVLRFGMRFEGGWLWRGNSRLPTLEERDVFRELQLAWVEPWERG